MNIKTEINKIHSQSSVSAICTNCKIEFNIDSGDLPLYEKIGLKIPEKCVECRWKQYFSFSVFGKFRKGVSDLSGESLITVLPAKPRYPIYKLHEWWGDGWDALSFGVDYDFSRSFFDQLKELQEKIPRPNQVGENNTNCDWSDDVWECKNCYLSRSLLKCENLYYGYRVIETTDSFDIVYSFNLQDSYDCLFCHNSFNLNFSENSKDCINSYFLFDCRNCQDCFMCFDLRNKQYCIRNKQYLREDYLKEVEKINLGSYKNVKILKHEFDNMIKNDAVHRENFNIKTTNSVGNYMTNCDKCVNVFAWENSQNCRNSMRGVFAKDCIDQAFSWNTELCGNNGAVDGGYELKHSACSIGRYSEYIDLCKEVEYCFGCVGLRKKQYCILNKQYDKESYEKLKAQIIADMEKRGEYGKFLPYSMGICDYNFSNGMAYFSNITKEEVLRNGGYWSEEDLSSDEGVSSLELPDSIKDTSSDVSTQALICPETHYRFNISKAEYEFHKRKNFTLPRLHFDRRIMKQVIKMSTTTSYPYKCFFCQKDINAYYPPEWGYQKIACEECYKQNIA